MATFCVETIPVKRVELCEISRTEMSVDLLLVDHPVRQRDLRHLPIVDLLFHGALQREMRFRKSCYTNTELNVERNKKWYFSVTATPRQNNVMAMHPFIRLYLLNAHFCTDTAFHFVH